MYKVRLLLFRNAWLAAACLVRLGSLPQGQGHRVPQGNRLSHVPASRGHHTPGLPGTQQPQELRGAASRGCRTPGNLKFLILICVFGRFSAALGPQNPSRSTGFLLQCRLHQKSARETNSKAMSWFQQIPAKLSPCAQFAEKRPPDPINSCSVGAPTSPNRTDLNCFVTSMPPKPL